jgi:two-component system NtrC family sensor kinase
VLAGGVVGVVIPWLVVQGRRLRRSESRRELLAAALEQTSELIVIARADGSIEHANGAFQRAVGFNLRELSGFRFPQPLDPEAAGLENEIPAEVRARGVWRGMLRRRRSDGSSLATSSTVVPFDGGSGALTHFLSIERDVTDELRLREQLVHSERLSAMGELVAGVAHEINNPLQAIIGSVELMMDDHTDTLLLRRDLEIVRREAARAAHIVRNLLSFARRSAPDRVAADLNEIVRDATELREYQLQKRNITLALQCASEALPVLVDPGQIQQVVLNLLVNAEQAIGHPSPGTILIRTMRVGARQVVDVIDSGPGIEPELRDRIFEPFFTTKHAGDGTGLGLSISQGIAAAHGGALETCETGTGACFRLALPSHEPQELPAGPAPALPGVRTRVVVVDDEEPIRRLLARLLVKRGYEVAEATAVDEAAALVATFNPGVVICDLRMPDGGGVELRRRLLDAGSESACAFIFITGDLAAVQRREPELAGAHILPKPFTAAELDTLLARVGTRQAGSAE